MPSTLRERYEASIPLLGLLATRLEEEVRASLIETSHAPPVHIDRICFRVKKTDSFLRKAEDPRNAERYTQPLVDIEDQVAGRVIVFFHSDIEPVKRLLDGIFTTAEGWHRQPERDAEFGYESHHLILLIPPHVKPTGWDTMPRPNTFEIQVRTVFMHAYSEPQHDLAYKSAEELPRTIRRELAWIAASAWGADQAYERINQLTRHAALSSASTSGSSESRELPPRTDVGQSSRVEDDHPTDP